MKKNPMEKKAEKVGEARRGASFGAGGLARYVLDEACAIASSEVACASEGDAVERVQAFLHARLGGKAANIDRDDLEIVTELLRTAIAFQRDPDGCAFAAQIALTQLARAMPALADPAPSPIGLGVLLGRATPRVLNPNWSDVTDRF